MSRTVCPTSANRTAPYHALPSPTAPHRTKPRKSTPLLTKAAANPKTAKGRDLPFESMILHLAPGNLSGHEVCPYRSKGCTFACLNTAGHGGIGGPDNSVQRARIRKTKMFFEDRSGFMAQLVKETETLVKRAKRKGLAPALRLNGTSDIGWLRIHCARDGQTYHSLMLAFPEVTFYDYTKVPHRLGANLPSNYTLTFSLSEDNDRHAKEALDHGFNVAAVLNLKDSDPMPESWGGYDVLDGTTHDFRFLDARGCVSGYIVGLRPKGRAKHDGSGFVRNLDAGLDLSRIPVYAAAA